MKIFARIALLCLPPFSVAWAQNAPVITLVANAEGEKPLIAPNTWIEIKGQNLSRANDTRIWQAADFVNNRMPTSLDGVSVTVNGKSAFLQSVVQNPGFANPAYPADDYSLPKGSPGAGFVVFDPNQAGRTNPVIKPPAVAATFPTKNFNPATDY